MSGFNYQMSLFDGQQELRIDKPIRLIELFAGIGAQAKALTNLGVPFEHYRICEFDKYAVKSYNAIHGTDFKTSDIMEITADDLGITETDKYCYIMTYSFPCTDLSKAGQQKGMAKGSGTRSGLLWEVERLLREIHDNGNELPQILLMENVPDVIGTKNIKHFADWVAFLDNIGYETRWEVLNAKNYGIPQNRDRCFAISWLKSMGDCYYAFPAKMELKDCLADVLQRTVFPKYYLSEKAVQSFRASMRKQQAKGNGFKFEPTNGGGTAKAVLSRAGERTCDNFIIETGNAVRENDRLCDDLNGERLQGFRQSSDDGGRGKNAHGVMLETSDKYNAGLLKHLSRSITTEGKNGVVEWKK